MAHWEGSGPSPKAEAVSRTGTDMAPCAACPGPAEASCPWPIPPWARGEALTAKRGGPPVPRAPASMGALAGELGNSAADAGGPRRTLALVLHTGLHVQLQGHQAQAALKGLGGQQPLALSTLRQTRTVGGDCSPSSLHGAQRVCQQA